MRVQAGPAQLALTLALVLMSMAGLGGCYTVLKHPGADVVGLSSTVHQDCYSCHGDTGPGMAYDPMHVPAFDYYGDAWYGFYAYPWWQRDIWFEDRYGYGGWHDSLDTQVPVADGSRRSLWGRGSYTPSVLPPNFATPPAAGAPAAGTAGTGEGGAAATPGTGQQEGRTLKNPVQPTPPPTPGVKPPPPVPPSPPAPSPNPGKNAKKDKKDKEEDTNKDKDPPAAWSRGGNGR